RALSMGRRGRAVSPTLGSRNPSGTAQDHYEDGCAPLQNRPGCPEGTDGLCHCLQSRPSGHTAIGTAPTGGGCPDELSRSPAVVRGSRQWRAVGGVVHQSLASPSGGTPRQKATPEKVSLYEQTPSRVTYAFATADVRA